MSIDKRFKIDPHLKRLILIGWIDGQYSEFKSETKILKSLIMKPQPVKNQIQSCIQKRKYHQHMMHSFAKQYRYEVQIHKTVKKM